METAQLLGNFGEFVGAIAVVLALGYLAIQVRTSKAAVSENMKSIRSAAAAATQDSLAAINELIASDSSLASLLDRVSQQGSMEGLSSDVSTLIERQRFNGEKIFLGVELFTMCREPTSRSCYITQPSANEG